MKNPHHRSAKPGENTDLVRTQLPPEIKAKALALANSRGLTMAAWLRSLIIETINKHQ